MASFKCLSVSQEMSSKDKDGKETVISELVRLVPADEVTFTKPQEETPSGNAKKIDPDGGKLEHKTYSIEIRLVLVDPKRLGKYSEGALYDLAL